MVGEGGLEPPLSCENQILSLARLPIPPLARIFQFSACTVDGCLLYPSDAASTVLFAFTQATRP